MSPAAPPQAPQARPLPQANLPPDSSPCVENPAWRPVLGDAGLRADQTANKSKLPGCPLAGAKLRAPLSPLPPDQAPIAGKSPALGQDTKVRVSQAAQDAEQSFGAGEAGDKAGEAGGLLELQQQQQHEGRQEQPREPEHAERDSPREKEAAAAPPETVLQAGSQGQNKGKGNGKGKGKAKGKGKGKQWVDLRDDLQVLAADTPLEIPSAEPREIEAQKPVRISYSRLVQATDKYPGAKEFRGAKEIVLREGKQSRVFRGDLFLGGCWVPVAIRRYFTQEEHSAVNDDLAEACFNVELDILTQIRHPNMVTLLGYWEHPMCLVYELLKGGNLADHLNNTSDKHGHFGWAHRIKVALEVCSAVQALHHCDPPVLHSNIKPGNVLLDKPGDSARLADFSMARALPIHGCIGGTQGYMDPDYLELGNSVTLAADVYALGVLLKHLLTGMTEWEFQAAVLQCSNVKALVGAAMLDDAAQWPGAVARRVAALAVQCTLREPKLRPTVDEMLGELEGAMQQGKKWKGAGVGQSNIGSPALRGVLCKDTAAHLVLSAQDTGM